jgi:sortase A
MKKKGSTIILILIFITGLAVMAYPTVSDYWNSFHSSRAIMSYAEAVADMSDEDYDRFYTEAEVYNDRIHDRGNPFLLSDEEKADYESLLNVGGNGIMGYIEIPSIKVSLPIYHGTSESVLQVAVGHLEWTSLPVGGTSTHCVLSGHRGLPSAKLFTDLDRLVEGDRFLLYILDEVLTYEVDQILIVLPEDVSELQVADGHDYCTLVTCTPYGINTHRLLVRGHRVETEEDAREIRVTADAVQIEPLFVAPILAVPILLALIAMLFAEDKNRWDDLTEVEEEVSRQKKERYQKLDGKQT